MNTKKYKNYESYIEHQKEKTLNSENRNKWLANYSVTVKTFREIFKGYKNILRDCKTAVCLGARMGEEVQTLIELGIETIGVDLVPYRPFVIEGDIHNVPLDSNCYDFVFSDVFDHALYPQKFIDEIHRLLKPDKYALLLLNIRGDLDDYDVNGIYNINEDVIPLLSNFNILKSRKFSTTFPYNWEILLQKK